MIEKDIGIAIHKIHCTFFKPLEFKDFQGFYIVKQVKPLQNLDLDII